MILNFTLTTLISIERIKLAGTILWEREAPCPDTFIEEFYTKLLENTEGKKTKNSKRGTNWNLIPNEEASF